MFIFWRVYQGGVPPFNYQDPLEEVNLWEIIFVNSVRKDLNLAEMERFISEMLVIDLWKQSYLPLPDWLALWLYI